MPKSAVIPCLRYRDAPAAIAWLVDVFGFEKHLVVPDENGGIAHAQLSLGGGMIIMTKHAIFLQHRAKPGARDAVQRVWQKHMQLAITENAGHEIYIYAFGTDPDRICAFQVYASAEAAKAFLKRQLISHTNRRSLRYLRVRPKWTCYSHNGSRHEVDAGWRCQKVN